MVKTTGRVTISVLGRIWMPPVVCALDIDANIVKDEGQNIVEYKDIPLTGLPVYDREAILYWLNLNAGDFQEIIDFSCALPDGSVIPWQSEDNELTYFDCMYGEYDED